MSMFSGITNKLSGLSFASAVAYMGGQQGAQMAYLYGPSLIRNAVISSAQRQFGYYAGTAIGNAAAPSVIVATMPTLVAQATVAGAFLAVTSLKTVASIYNYAIHVRASHNFQKECRALAPACERLTTNTLMADQEYEEVQMG